jgi:hypothetical protein
MSNSTKKDIIICHETRSDGQSYCSILKSHYERLPESASNLVEAKKNTLEYLQTIPDNKNITDADIQIHSGTLRENKHGTQYVTANSRDSFFKKLSRVFGSNTDYFVAFIPTNFKFLPATSNTSHTNSEDVNGTNSEDVIDTNVKNTNSIFSTGGHRRYKKKRTARKTTRRGKKSNRRTRGKK